MHSQTENKELMAEGWSSFTKHWGIGMGGVVVYFLIVGGIQAIPVLGIIISLVIAGAMMIGINTLNLAIARGENAQISQLFEGFSNFKTALVAYLLQFLFILLWTLLLIIPGIIAAYSYAMTFYILADDKTIGARDAIAKSKHMMDGNKAKLFFLSLRFMLWIIIPIMLSGIVFAMIIPHAAALVVKVLIVMLVIAMIAGILIFTSYMGITLAKFYDDLKKNQLVQEAALV